MSRRRSLEKIAGSTHVTIGELARLTGARYSTLKYYTEEGMLPYMQEEDRRTRRFPREEAMLVLEEINRLKKLGFRIPEIKHQINLSKEKDPFT